MATVNLHTNQILRKLGRMCWEIKLKKKEGEKKINKPETKKDICG